MKVKNCIRKKASALAFSLVMVIAIFASVPSAMAASEKTYTLDADFDAGTLVGVEHDTVPDQLQLSKEQTTLPFIWVPNSPVGSVSKVDTVTGNELGRYYVYPPGTQGTNGNPSRTTVDLKGNVWVGNREGGTVVKIGLYENGQCVDRNGDGIIETSRDSNNDGDITGAEQLPWGQDECVLYEVSLIPGKEGTFVPGTPHPAGFYDTNYWGTAPRGLAIDSSNNLWAGTSTTNRMFYINGDTGAIEKNINVAGIGGNGAYGAVIDGNGKVWIAVLSTGVRKFDPSTNTITQVINLWHTYGLGLDYEGNLLVGGSGQISKIRTSDGVVLWTKPASASQGITATSDNNIWVASNTEHRYDINGNWIASIPGFSTSVTGVAVDAAGKVWGSEMSEYIRRVDPVTNTIDLSKRLIGSGYHYTYSDITGIMARTVTTKIGTWTVDFDSEAVDTPWGTVSWTSDEPANTSVKVQVRSSNDKASWSAWEIATNNVKLTATPPGKYLQVETTLQSDSDGVSPILYDLTVRIGNQPPVANPGGPYVGDEGSAITFDGSASSDPDAGDQIVSYEWDLDGDGTFESSGVNVTKTWPDDYSGTVTLRVTDTFGVSDTKSTTVTVNNVAPSVKLDSSYYATVPVTLRIAGQGKVGNSVGLDIIQNGTVIANGKIIRKPGSPNEQEVTINAAIDLSKPYSGRLVFDTEDALSGGTPVWLITNGNMTKVTTFNTQKSKPASYHQTYDFSLAGIVSLVGAEVTFSGTATDPGSDDMTFDWVFGDSGTASKLYPWSGSHTVTDTVKHTYSVAGSYTVNLNVADGDGGVGSDTKTIVIS
ncbi:MAG: PKD domain-containing protein [Candidatus Methanoperedens sp.]|nr:PKD domain-containing protein [Candidatus Methanoperedens sp.]